MSHLIWWNTANVTCRTIYLQVAGKKLRKLAFIKEIQISYSSVAFFCKISFDCVVGELKNARNRTEGRSFFSKNLKKKPQNCMRSVFLLGELTSFVFYLRLKDKLCDMSHLRWFIISNVTCSITYLAVSGLEMWCGHNTGYTGIFDK